MKTDVKVWGEIVDVLPGLTFKVKLVDGRIVLCYVAGKMRMNKIALALADKVELVLSPDGQRGRITWRR